MTAKYLWQKTDPGQHWTDLITFNAEELIEPIGACRFLQGKLTAHMENLKFEERLNIFAEALHEEVLATSEIAGEPVSPQAADYAISIRLGVPAKDLKPTQNRYTEGIVSVLVDAISNCEEPLTTQRLKSWHTSLFPPSSSGRQTVEVGKWRSSHKVSALGMIRSETMSREVPPPDQIEEEMQSFIHWFQGSKGQGDGILRAALSHLWIATISPFTDGNGRIARALSDMVLTQDDPETLRFFTLSPQIMLNQDSYLEVLQKTQTGSGDITLWLQWYCNMVHRSLKAAQNNVEATAKRSQFWARLLALPLTDRQRMMVKEVFLCGPGGYKGGLTNKKYTSMTGTSRQTAQRELADLVNKGVLYAVGAGRAVKYGIAIWQEQEKL